MEKPWFKDYVPNTPHEIKIPAGSLGGYLDRAIQEFPENTAMHFEGLKISCRELGQFVNRAADGFARLGVKKGDTVAIMLPNVPQFVMAYFGALKCGAIVTPVNPLSVPRELRIYLQDTKVKTIVTLNFFYKTVNAVREESSLENVIVTAARDTLCRIKQMLAPKLVYKHEMKEVPPLRRGDLLWNEWLAQSSPNAPTPVDIKPGEDLAVYQFTGGTTGIPKAVMLTHDNLKANCEQCGAWMQWLASRGKETFVAALPLQHIFGQTVAMNLAISWGCAILLIPNPRDIKEKMAAYKVPTDVESVENLPKSMVGKVLRRELREKEKK